MTRRLIIDQTIICADELRQFGQGDHFRFIVNAGGVLIEAKEWNPTLCHYEDITRRVKEETKFLERLQRYYFENKKEPFAQDYIEDWDGGGAA